MTQRNSLTGPMRRRVQTKLYHLGILCFTWSVIILLSTACAAQPTATPTPSPTPTPTRPPMPANNDNVQALNEAQAALGQYHFGFAPLLEEDGTRVVIEDSPRGPVARLAYPLQPDDPRQWPAMDSFILAYAVQTSLLESPKVRLAGLSRFSVAAAIGPEQEFIDHVAVWVRFTDGSQAIVDLTPLSTNFGARHPTQNLLTNPDEIKEQFNQWRHGVPLSLLQPMKVVEEGGNVYYLLARVQVSPQFYEFSLRAYLVQTATPMRPLLLSRGTMATLKIQRSDFEAVQAQLTAGGPAAFSQNPGMVSRAGDDNPTLNTILDKHLDLLWHLVSKLEQTSTGPVGTPVPAPTPTATPTPTPTPTRAKLPLLTS